MVAPLLDQRQGDRCRLAIGAGPPSARHRAPASRVSAGIIVSHISACVKSGAAATPTKAAIRSGRARAVSRPIHPPIEDPTQHQRPPPSGPSIATSVSAAQRPMVPSVKTPPLSPMAGIVEEQQPLPPAPGKAPLAPGPCRLACRCETPAGNTTVGARPRQNAARPVRRHAHCRFARVPSDPLPRTPLLVV